MRDTMSDDNTLAPIEQRSVDFYGDTITAVLVQIEDKDQVYVPVRPISDYLGVSWAGQRERINRDLVLSEMVKGVRVTRTPDKGGTQVMVCLPLRFINGWLFGINASRVKEQMREKVIQYQRECYDILANAFLERTGTAVSPSAAALAQIRENALAIAEMAGLQIEHERRLSTTENRLDRAAAVVGELGRRVSKLEQRVSPGQPVTDEQAAEIAQQVKALAGLLTEHDPGLKPPWRHKKNRPRRMNVDATLMLELPPIKSR